MVAACTVAKAACTKDEPAKPPWTASGCDWLARPFKSVSPGNSLAIQLACSHGRFDLPLPPYGPMRQPFRCLEFTEVFVQIPICKSPPSALQAQTCLRLAVCLTTHMILHIPGQGTCEAVVILCRLCELRLELSFTGPRRDVFSSHHPCRVQEDAGAVSP